MLYVALALTAATLGLAGDRGHAVHAPVVAHTASQRPQRFAGTFLTVRQTARIRRAAGSGHGPYAVLGKRTIAAARRALHAPVDIGNPDGFQSSAGATWRDDLYLPGRAEAGRVRACAVAFMLTRQTRYARCADRGLVHWASAWSGVTAVPGHSVAGTVVVQLGLFYGFVRNTLHKSERATVDRYFRAQELLARRLVQAVVDQPWDTAIPGSVRYGNGATWPRLAEAAAAFALRDDAGLRAAVEGPPGGDYDLDQLIRGGIRTDAPPGTTGAGRWVEEDERASLGYAWFALNNIGWTALLAEVRGISVDLAPLEAVYRHYVPWFRRSPLRHPALRGWKGRSGVSWNCHDARPTWTDCSDPSAQEYFSDHELDTTYEAARAGYGVATLLWPGNESFRAVALAADSYSAGSVGNDYDPYVAGFGGLYAAAGAR